jgi:ABC-type transport system involved in cytochrome bd biosynthesis fused ATPase/permease subunit
MITLGQGKPTIKVKFGETLRIAGPSGRGKTSLVLAMIGAGAPVNHLDVRWNKKLVKEGVLENACLIGQEPFFLPGTIQDNIELLVESCNIDFVVSASKMLGLHLEKSDLSRNISTLSGGERQKLAIAMSYCNDKSVYIFDESTNSLHESEANQLINYVAGREQSVLLYISHQNIRVNNEFELSIA